MAIKLTPAQARAVAERMALDMGVEAPRKPAGKPKKAKDVDRTFQALCIAHSLPVPYPEYRFCERKWRLDWAWPKWKVALEIDGGAWTGGRHTRGAGFIKDQEKRNRAVIMGWRVLHCTPQDVKSGTIFPLLKEMLG